MGIRRSAKRRRRRCDESPASCGIAQSDRIVARQLRRIACLPAATLRSPLLRLTDRWSRCPLSCGVSWCGGRAGRSRRAGADRSYAGPRATPERTCDSDRLDGLILTGAMVNQFALACRHAGDEATAKAAVGLGDWRSARRLGRRRRWPTTSLVGSGAAEQLVASGHRQLAFLESRARQPVVRSARGRILFGSPATGRRSSVVLPIAAERLAAAAASADVAIRRRCSR